MVVDSGRDLNAYAKVENQSGCCSPARVESGTLPVAGSDALHGRLGELLKRYDVNAYAASVGVFAIKGA